MSKLKLDEWWNGGSKGARIVDIGAGTGNFSAALAEEVAAWHRVLCVEPSKSLCDIQKLYSISKLVNR